MSYTGRRVCDLEGDPCSPLRQEYDIRIHSMRMITQHKNGQVGNIVDNLALFEPKTDRSWMQVPSDDTAIILKSDIIGHASTVWTATIADVIQEANHEHATL